jgi:enoyl-CoA hydratase/carnithine racemase
MTRIIGFARAMEMFLTCRSVKAQEALEMGLVNRVVESANLRVETEQMVERLVSLPPIALQMTKRAVIHAYGADLSSHLELMAAYQGITQRSSDHFKALEGMVNKSRPTFDHY